MISELVIGCIFLSPFFVIDSPGYYPFCPGSYESYILVESDNVSIECFNTTIVGPNETLWGTWTQGIQIVDGDHAFENISVVGCSFSNMMVAISGVEVEEEGSHGALPGRGSLTLRNNHFFSPFSLFFCSEDPGSVYLENNFGSDAVVLGTGSVTQFNDGLSVLDFDPTEESNSACPVRREKHIKRSRPTEKYDFR